MRFLKGKTSEIIEELPRDIRLTKKYPRRIEI